MESLHNPKVSIIIPNYNRAHLISETLDSLLKQSYTLWEAVVVDDGSTDESIKVIEDFAKKDSRIKFLKRTRETKGAPVCRNIGFEHSESSLIIFLDSDDILAPYCLSTRIKHFRENADCDFLVFPMLVFNERPGDSAVLWNINNNEDDLTRFLKGDIPWQTTSPIWKREAIDKIGGWDEEAFSWQDWEFHIKAIVLGLNYKKIEALPDCFLRRDESARISNGEVSPMQLYPKLDLFSKIHFLIKESNKLSEINKRSFAHLLFNHAERCAVYCYHEPLAERYSNKIIEFCLLPGNLGYLQLLYIKSLIAVKRRKIPYLSILFYLTSRFLFPLNLTKRRSPRFKFSVEAKTMEQVKKLLKG